MNFRDLRVSDEWDYDKEISIGGEYLGRDEVLRLRDHLTELLKAYPDVEVLDNIALLKRRVEELESAVWSIKGY